MEDQTNNRIREEWKEWAFTHKQHLGRMCDRKEIEDYWISKLDSLLKQQREEMIENKKATCLGNPEWMLSIENRIKNETLDDIITNLTHDTNPKE
jgi:hypothetical protein